MAEAYKYATIDISNICNAKCRWCTTGVKNRKGIVTKPEFMSAELFKKGLSYMLDKGILNEKAELELYNWGEPLLNPELQGILAVINEYGLSFHISTNASVIRNFTGENIDNMTYFMVSMSGFSQSAYGKIHGFELNRILENIDKIAEILKSHNKLDKMQINMHMYKFNLHEYEDARKYFAQRGINFVPRLAYFNDYFQFQNYLNNTASKKTQEITSRQIITTLIDELAAKAPADYRCPQLNRIVTDEKWNIVPCCRLTTNESLGNLFELSLEDIAGLKEDCKYCPPCIEAKQDFIVHQPMRFHLGI